MKTQTQNIQIALMFQNTFTGSFKGVLSSYKEKYPDVLENVIPLPDNFPEDSVPRLEVRHKEKKILVRFAKNRADIITDNDTLDSDLFSDFIERILRLGITVGRIGYVKKTVYSKIDIAYVTEKMSMIDDSWLDNEILEASQRINKKGSIKFGDKEIICNNIASLTLGKDKKAENLALLLERDMNTLQDTNLGLKDYKEVKDVVSLLEEGVSETIFNM